MASGDQPGNQSSGNGMHCVNAVTAIARDRQLGTVVSWKWPFITSLGNYDCSFRQIVLDVRWAHSASIHRCQAHRDVYYLYLSTKKACVVLHSLGAQGGILYYLSL